MQSPSGLAGIRLPGIQKPPASVKRRRRRRRRELIETRRFGARDFMSASSDLAVVFGAPLKLCFSSVSSFSAQCMRKSLCCALQQSTHFFFPTVSMRLRPKRTCSGVECFGGYHINRLFNIFLFLRGPLT
ncbi:hypothetical protein Sango_1100200 [Sesamum angolense]|uniref:Uncharacterized protein n=1 Tax=Sesamum angolense TaxID=2727404 RepID=A0AAE1WV11_9LAMI|nr:hypothetical protein Sango_1100200 [Sesamum angolense]